MARNEKKKAMNAYIDAQAKAQKAANALSLAVDRFNATAADEEEARSECERQGLPVGPKPPRMTVAASKPEPKP